MKKIIANLLIFIGSLFGVDLVFINWSQSVLIYSKPVDIPTYRFPDYQLTDTLFLNKDMLFEHSPNCTCSTCKN